MSKITKEKIKELEKKYGKHKFCYQCGSLNIKYLEYHEPFTEGLDYCFCLDCGSSDLDE